MKQGDRQQVAAGSGSSAVPSSAAGAAEAREPKSGAVGAQGMPAAFAARFDAVDGAESALAGVEEVLHQCVGSELGPAFARLDALARRVEAAKVAVLAEAIERGEVTCSHASAGAWVLEWAPSHRSGGVRDLVSVATACTGRPVRAGMVVDHGSVRRLRSCVLSGRVGVRGAAVALAEMHKLAPRLTREAVPTVWEGFLTLAASEGPAGVRGLRERLIAEHGRDREFQVRQDRLKHGVSLSPGRVDDGMVEYLLRLDPEGASVLEAAIGPLSAPQPADGVSDLRSSDQRRGDALVAVCRRSTAAAEGVPAQAKALLFLTMDFDSLKRSCGAATTLDGGGTNPGGTDAGDDGQRAGGSGVSLGNGTLIAPETVRRIACDAGIIPMVLGSKGEILDQGRTKRLFTPAQLAHLWKRDGGCSIPGCQAPPWWCDGHHVTHWADGGPTDVKNAALLCARHHTIVHQKGWTATVTDTGVTWHL